MKFTPRTVTLPCVLLLCLVLLASAVNAGAPEKEDYLSPTALVAARDGKTLFIACATAKQVLGLDVAGRRVKQRFTMPEPPLGLALSPDDARLIVTCASPESQVCIVDVAEGKTAAIIPAGHTAMAPVLSPDGRLLFVCNRFNNDVSFIDLVARKELRRVPVRREPVAADITPDGKYLLVANLLHDGRADADYVSALVSVIEVKPGKVVKELGLPNGSGALNDLRVSPDGRHAVVTHILSRFPLPTTQLDRGWVNTNAKTIIDLETLSVVNTVLLDNVDSGAANPWGVAWTRDSRTVVVAHAGTHEVSIIDFAGLLDKLNNLPASLDQVEKAQDASASRIQADVPNDLAFLVGLRQRVKLPPGDLGPRAVAVIGNKAYVANYFSDSLSVIDLAAERPRAESIPLGPPPKMSVARQGEYYFHTATICFQGWQSCSSCHPGGARTDGLNWDLLNDGLGNPKNNKSLLLAHKTPPAMSMGVRETAEMAVRAGIRHILFTVQPDEVGEALDEYLKALERVPSPYLVDGKLSESARRGRTVFDKANCAACHPPGLFTDLQHHQVGTRSRPDLPEDKFDTPTLIEVWRTAPYLHDGSAATMRDLLTMSNPKDQHGLTSKLTNEEIDDLIAYVLSL